MGNYSYIKPIITFRKKYQKRNFADKKKSIPGEYPKMLLIIQMVGVTELESVTSTMSTWRSNQLSYTPIAYGL